MGRKVTRKWEIFAGKNKFYCDGRLMTAPKTTVFYLTVFLITGTSGLFFAFDCPFLARKITPAIPIIGGVLYVFVMSSLFRTSFSDPGIIPRASADEAADIEKQIEVPNSLNSPTYRPPPRTKEVCVNGQTVKLKYCFTCKLFRPPRASHCSLCDNCVERFDHHCPWVGNCVGKRNYRFFYMFIVSLAFLAVFIFSCAMTHIILLTKENEPVIVVIRDTPSSVIVATICFFSVWSVIGLAGFHTYLTSSDQTTNEDIKGSFSSKNGQQAVNPYSRGNICRNCFHILCGPVAPSLIDRRGIVTEDDRMQMEYDAKYTSVQQPTLVVQPIPATTTTPTGNTIVLDPFNRPYNTEINKSETGFYRQRSYDNLQPNDKSGSVAHLVENEIPLSTSTVAVKQLDDTKVILGNLTDSYNNLLNREPPPLPQDDVNAVQIIQHHRPSIRNENVYSNVLPTPIGQSRIQPVPGPLKPIRPAELQTWNEAPTAHVYSNIEEKMHESIDIFLKSMPYQGRRPLQFTGETEFDNDNDDEDDDDDGDQENADRMTVSDDNDDTNNGSTVGTDELVNNSGKLTLSTSSSSAATAATQIDLRNAVIRPSSITTAKLGGKEGHKNGTITGGNNNSIGSSNSIGNTSDLDGSSSIGNNSQSCLVKPAIV